MFVPWLGSAQSRELYGVGAFARAIRTAVLCFLFNKQRGCEDLVQAEYVTELGRAPALECVQCRALNLNVVAAKDEEERDSVKLAIAVREAICQVPSAR